MDNWLTHKPVFTGEEQSNMLVSELIDEDTGLWNRQKVQELFAPSTRCEILAIPLNALHRRDELEWKENRARSFSVKDAYQVALRLCITMGLNTQMLGTLFGEHVQTFSPLRWRWSRDTTYAVNSLNRHRTCYGNVHWHGMCGQYRKEGCRNVATRCRTSSNCFECWRVS